MLKYLLSELLLYIIIITGCSSSMQTSLTDNEINTNNESIENNMTDKKSIINNDASSKEIIQSRSNSVNTYAEKNNATSDTLTCSENLDQKQEKDLVNKTCSNKEEIWESPINSYESIMVISNKTDKDFDFKYYEWGYDEQQYSQYGFNGKAIFISENIAEFNITDNSCVDIYSSVKGKINFNDNHSIITYSYESYEKQHTITLNKNDNTNILNKMPFYTRELMLNGNRINHFLFYEPNSSFGEPNESKIIPYIGDETYTENIYDGYSISFVNPDNIIKHITIDKPDICIIRDIKIGDSLNEVIDKFPNEQKEIIVHFDTPVKPLYGNISHGSNYGMIEYVDETPKKIIYSFGGDYLVFHLDEKLEIILIEYYY